MLGVPQIAQIQTNCETSFPHQEIPASQRQEKLRLEQAKGGAGNFRIISSTTSAEPV